MKNQSLLIKLFAVVAAMMCALGANAAKAYACYTLSDSTLTFYFDDQYFSRPGAKYELETNTAQPGWCEDGTREYVTRVVFDPSFADARPVEISSWFYGMSNLLSINGMEYLNTSNVINMAFMFTYCHRLTSLDLSNFNTANVYNMNGMFSHCSGLTSLDVSSFNTVNVKYMASMFSHCSGLTSLDVSSFNTSNVTDMSDMFIDCSGLTSLDLSNFNTTKVTDMSDMFIDCSGLTSLDLSNFNTANVKEMSWMFYGCRSLTTIYAGSGWSTAAVTSSANMFWNCTSLVGGQGTTYDASHIDKTYARIDGGPSNPGYFTEKKEAYACYTPSNTTLTFYYDNKRASRTGTTYDLPADEEAPGWNIDDTRSSVTRVVFNSSFADARPTSTGSWFMMNNLASITGIEYLNTSEVTDMGLMFFGCESLTSLDVSGFNTAKVTDMAFMFCNCSSLTSLDVSHFNTSEVTTMYRMFSVCSSLTSLDLSGFNTAKVKNMESMFWGCSSLTSLDLTSFNTAKVTNMESMFRICSGLTSLNLSNFNTTNVTNMSYMFSSCSSLTNLDLSSFNTAKVTNMNYMFNYCGGLKTIYVADCWSTAAVTSSTSMFSYCTSLVGGKGTTYDANHIDASYAHIDGGTSNPGYMSEHQIEAYACYTPSNTTLTFYYDKLRHTRTGTTYDLNTGNNPPAWYNDRIYSSVTRVVFDPSFADARPISTCEWFVLMDKLQSITGMEYLNTSEVTRMIEMFGGCTQLTTLDLSSFNTSKVTSMVGMFDNCIGLTSLDLSNFDTSNVTDMHIMFAGCSNLNNIDVTQFNTANVTDMSSMFYHCTELTEIDVSHFNTASVTSMYNMFNSCSGLTTLDLSSFNTAKVEYMNYMFYNCSNLTSIYVGSGWSTAAVTLSDGMFDDCTRIRGGKGTTYDANHVDASYAHIDGGTSNPGYLTAGLEAYACYTSSNTTLTFYYDSLRSTRTGTTYSLNNGDAYPDWYNDHTCQSVTRVVFDPSFADARPTSTYNWFARMQNLTGITGMKSYLNTSAVTDMSYMFYYCTHLASIDVSGFNTANVTNMQCMFFYCHELAYLDLRNFNTANVANMQSMFAGCNKMSSLNLSTFNTANVADMDYVFQGCTELSNLNMKNINTSNVTSMTGMFWNCSSLTSLDLSSFNTSGVVYMGNMFRGCSELTTIYVGDGWNTSAVDFSSMMFLDCLKIKGSQGTTYDANYTNKAYARIDGGTARPGYLSEVKVSYAVYTSDNTTLTFYYDGQRDSRPGTTYDLPSGTNDAGWYTDGSYESVTQVVFDPSFVDARPKSAFCWFSGMRSLYAVSGMEYLNTSQITDMYAMFYFCSGLTSLDLSHFNTANVTDMRYVFSNCINLTTIYAGGGWSTAAVNKSENMFKNCTKLVGGKGTTFDANHIDKAYAHIDGGPSDPGYFTEKVDFLRGDVNGDGAVNIADVTALIDLLLGNSGNNNPAADCNMDNAVNIADVTKLIDYLLSGAWD